MSKMEGNYWQIFKLETSIETRDIEKTIQTVRNKRLTNFYFPLCDEQNHWKINRICKQ